MKTIKLNVEGMTCASCANTIELALTQTDGVGETSINIATDTGLVTFDERKLAVSDILAVIGRSGYAAREDMAGRGATGSDDADTDVRNMKLAKTVVLVAEAGALLGYVAIADQLKPGAKAVLERIEAMGIKTAMLTGDNDRTANAIARQAGVSHVIANIMPDGKVAEVKKLQSAFGLVAMVGDGINDAPALKQANVGMAIGTGTDVAIEAADVTLVRGDLDSILAAIVLSRAIFRKIKENYFWAWFYNAVAIPFAMLGLLHPMIGAAAMSVSSLNVVHNSLRLRKLDLDPSLRHSA